MLKIKFNSSVPNYKENGTWCKEYIFDNEHYEDLSNYVIYYSDKIDCVEINDKDRLYLEENFKNIPITTSNKQIYRGELVLFILENW